MERDFKVVFILSLKQILVLNLAVKRGLWSKAVYHGIKILSLKSDQLCSHPGSATH